MTHIVFILSDIYRIEIHNVLIFEKFLDCLLYLLEFDV